MHVIWYWRLNAFSVRCRPILSHKKSRDQEAAFAGYASIGNIQFGCLCLSLFLVLLLMSSPFSDSLEPTGYCSTNISLIILQVDLSVHILDIHAIESKKPEQASGSNALSYVTYNTQIHSNKRYVFLQIVIQYGEKHVKFCLIKPGIVHFVIGQLIANLKLNFPGGNLE